MAQQWNLERVRDMWRRGSRRHIVSFLDPFGATPHGFTPFNNSMCNNHCSPHPERRHDVVDLAVKSEGSDPARESNTHEELWRWKACGSLRATSLTTALLLPCPEPYWAWPSASNNSRSGLLQQMLPWQSTEWKNNIAVMFLTKSFKLSLCSYCNSMCIYNLLQHLCFGNKRKKKIMTYVKRYNA